MKACLLAGGPGTRLHPLTSCRPKPMMRIYDKPVLEYALASLKAAGVNECLMTLLYLPDCIRNYFGDKYDGMRLRYAVEEKPVGTAGGMLAFREALSDDDFFVVSGDAVFDLDLRSAMLFHKEKKASATLILSRAADPTGFGTVLTDEDGCIAGFREKPAWESVSTGRVNTGLYAMSPAVFEKIPSGRDFDFSLDLFPLLLADRTLYGIELPGYWHDMGTPEGYLEAARDGLSGKWAPSIPPAGRDAPPNVLLKPPCYLSPEARVADGAVVGPFASLESGADIAKGCSISFSSVFGKTGEDSIVTGAVLDRGCRIGRGTAIAPLAVVGEGAVIGNGCLIGSGVHVCCDAVIEDGSLIRSARDMNGLTFSHRVSVASGRAVLKTLEDAGLLASGLVAAFGKRIALAPDDALGEAPSFADAFQAEACALGADIYRHDAPTPAVSAYMTKRLAASAGVYFTPMTGGGVEALIYNRDGVRLSSRESGFSLRRRDPEPGSLAGRVRMIRGAADLYAAEGAVHPVPESYVVCCRDSVLKGFLRNAGVTIADAPEGLPFFDPASGGHSLSLVSEKGYAFTPDEVTLLILAALYTAGKERLAIASDAPCSAESLAADSGKTLLRVGRDEESYKLYAGEPALHQGAYAAVALIKALILTGKTLSSFSASIPSCVSVLRDYRTRKDRADLMDRFAESVAGVRMDRSDGVRMYLDGSYLSLHPSPYEKLLTLKAESANEETAAELCDFYFEKLKELENGGK